MKRYEMIKDKDEFNNIINKGKKIGNKYFLIFSVKKDFVKPNFGIAVSKKYGNAVARNKIKRQLRNIIDNNKMLFKNSHNYIIMIKKECLNKSFHELENNFKKLFVEDTHEK